MDWLSRNSLSFNEPCFPQEYDAAWASVCKSTQLKIFYNPSTDMVDRLRIKLRIYS